MLIVIAIALTLLVVAFGVAAWQVTREDRAERAAMAARVVDLVRRENLHVGHSMEQDGVTYVQLGRGDGSPSA